MKKDYLIPLMEVVHVQMTGHLLENSIKVSNETRPNSEALSPYGYDDEEEDDYV